MNRRSEVSDGFAALVALGGLAVGTGRRLVVLVRNVTRSIGNISLALGLTANPVVPK